MTDQEYIDAARADPAVRNQRKITLMALSFHLWAMTREERAKVTVASLRESKKLLHGYITDAEIAAVLDAENSRVYIDPLTCRESDTFRMAETGTGSGRSQGSAVPEGDSPPVNSIPDGPTSLGPVRSPAASDPRSGGATVSHLHDEETRT